MSKTRYRMAIATNKLKLLFFSILGSVGTVLSIIVYPFLLARHLLTNTDTSAIKVPEYLGWCLCASAFLLSGKMVVAVLGRYVQNSKALSSGHFPAIEPTSVPNLDLMMKELRIKLGLGSREIRLVAAITQNEPQVVAVGRNVFCVLPLNTLKLVVEEPQAARAVLCHELAHIRHGDVRLLAYFDGVFEVAQELVWFLCGFSVFYLVASDVVLSWQLCAREGNLVPVIFGVVAFVVQSALTAFSFWIFSLFVISVRRLRRIGGAVG